MPASEEVKDLINQTISKAKEQAHEINNTLEFDISYIDEDSFRKIDKDFSKLHLLLTQLENEISFL